MRVHLYTGSLSIVKKSGVGQAIYHQKDMLEGCGVTVTDSWKGRSDAVHINTVFPDAVLAAIRARLRGETVVYYGHSTMQDFRNSFVGSNFFAPLFRSWLCFCYNLGDVVLTPTPYSKRILESYGLKRPAYAISNGVDTSFFAPSAAARERFRKRFSLNDQDKVVISVGHFMERKGILDFIELARSMPEVQFYWFGYTDPALVPGNVKKAMLHRTSNLHFPGFLDREALRDAYCGADAFCFCSQEETEGIVVLEALACKTPTLLRDIPVYSDWLTDGLNVYKAEDASTFKERLQGMLDGTLPDLTGAGHAVAEARNLNNIGRQLCALYPAEKQVNSVFAEA
jgi:1,2-diacylglycerol-3-alpha-glucose alpha-1,2-glucosyltransferase